MPQVAVFDTAFHQTMPEHAYTYAVPVSWREKHRIRRYGFHGTSYAFVSRRAAELLGRAVEDTNLVVLHLGNGASAAAVRGGQSIDTSMGLTPLEGLVMGTRSGDLDPAIHGHLHRELGWSVDEIDRVLYRESGMLGLCGVNDFREVTQRRADGDAAATLAFDVYAYRVRKYVGAYYAALGELHAVVFTGGVGQHSSELRAAALGGLERLGIVLDPARNDAPSKEARAVSADWSDVAVLVVPTDEEWEIARQALAVVRGSGRERGLGAEPPRDAGVELGRLGDAELHVDAEDPVRVDDDGLEREVRDVGHVDGQPTHGHHQRLERGEVHLLQAVVADQLRPES